MSEGDYPADDLTLAERRLSEHLELLRASPPIAPPELIARIVRRARWQRSIRDPLLFAGMVALAMTEGLALLSGPGARER
jgi:hypothetical protein